MVRNVIKIFVGFFFVFIMLFSAQVSAQLVNVISTTLEEQVCKKYNHFSMVETDIDLAVGLKCVDGKNCSDLPLLFFQEAVFTPERAIEIHTLNTNSENMVLEHNKSEDDIFFVKSKFVVGNYSKSWFVLLDAHSIVLKNCSSHKYLGLSKDGNFYPVTDLVKASRFKLIHHF